MTSIILISDSPSRAQLLSDMIRFRLQYSLQALPLNALRRPELWKPAAYDLAVLDIGSGAGQFFQPNVKMLRERCQRCMLIVLYPFGDSDAESLAVEAGADEILARPVTLERLRVSLRNMAQLHDMKARLDSAGGRSLAPVNLAVQVPKEPAEVRSLRAVEAEAILQALRHFDGRITHAAKALGVGRSTLYRKIDELGLDAQAFQAHPNGAETYSSSRANHTTRPMMRVSATGRT